ncbi:MAG: deoxyguanosinetriphosphate triphosphohydrolase, partial [Bradyrhizobium sp.]
DSKYPALDADRRGAALVRELISYLIGSAVAESERRLDVAQPNSVDEVRHHGRQLIAFSAEVAEAEARIKGFLEERMYRHSRVMRIMKDAEQIVLDLFRRYQTSSGNLPPEWQEGTEELDDHARGRRIGNFIAGMTDRYALIEHQRLFDSTPDLR